MQFEDLIKEITFEVVVDGVALAPAIVQDADKGDTSGNVMTVVAWAAYCDSDVLLFKVRMQGPQVACHTGARSCFFKVVDRK